MGFLYPIPKCSERFTVARRFKVRVVGMPVASAKPSVSVIRGLMDDSPTVGKV